MTLHDKYAETAWGILDDAFIEEGRPEAAQLIQAALIAAHREGMKEERERCAERFLTFTGLEAENNTALTIVQITRGLRAIRDAR